MTLSEKIAKMLDERGRGSRARLADYLGVKRNYVTRWLKDPDYGVPRDHLPKIAEFLGINVSDLFGEATQFYTIPLIGLASCGIPKEYDLNGYEKVPVGAEIYKSDMYAVKAEGDSMKPKINNKDLVYCRSDAQIENGNIVHYSYNGESGIKRYKINEKRDIIILLPINQYYDPITIPVDDVGSLRMSKVVGVVDTDF